MHGLRSLSIPIRHDPSRFLDVLLPSELQLHTVSQICIFARPELCYTSRSRIVCISSTTSSTSSHSNASCREQKILLISSHTFGSSRVLYVSSFRFPTYRADIAQLYVCADLLDESSLETCPIVPPREIDTLQVTYPPLCTGLCFDVGVLKTR